MRKIIYLLVTIIMVGGYTTTKCYSQQVDTADTQEVYIPKILFDRIDKRMEEIKDSLGLKDIEGIADTLLDEKMKKIKEEFAKSQQRIADMKEAIMGLMKAEFKIKLPKELVEYLKVEELINSHKREWEEQFSTASYHEKLIMLRDEIEMLALYELYLLRLTSALWSKCISEGIDFDLYLTKILLSQTYIKAAIIRQGFFELIKENLTNIKKPPQKYVKEYDLLVELFLVYSQIYSLACFPQGSYISFSRTVNNLSLEFEKCLAKLDIFL